MKWGLDASVALKRFFASCAITLAKSLDHHLFDTLHHPVALHHGATPVTPDTKYFKKAKGLGAMVWLGAPIVDAF